MSPVFILSRLCLNRRFQFFGMTVPSPVSAPMTSSTICSSITWRSPTLSPLSQGTLTVMSLCRIWIVRYSRCSPRTSRDSRLTTTPAPWCGYTTLSPTSNKPTSRVDCVLPPDDRRRTSPPVNRPIIAENGSKRGPFPALFRSRQKSPGNELLQLQVPLREVVLLEPPQAVANLLRADRSDALDR